MRLIRKSEMNSELPPDLRASSYEEIKTKQGSLKIPKATPTFQEWLGPPIKDPLGMGKKPLVDYMGRPMFAELRILHLLSTSGWYGVWINSFRKKFHIEFPNEIAQKDLPQEVRDRLIEINGNDKFPVGAWDLCCFKDSKILFVESKKKRMGLLRIRSIGWKNVCG